jgi:restriction endonuclease S subunit
MERITIKGIEERFEKWNKNDVVRIRGYFKGAGKPYVFQDKTSEADAYRNDTMIIFTIPNDKIIFYKVRTGDYFTLPKSALNVALKIEE